MNEITVSELADAYLVHLAAMVHSGQRAPSTLDWYSRQFKRLKKMAGHLTAACLKPQHLLVERVTYQFARAAKTLYRWAAEEEMIAKNTIRRMSVPRCGQRTRVLDRSEMAKIYLASPRHFRRFLFMARFTLARPGELRCLRWSQVDLVAGVIRLKSFKAKDRRQDRLQERVIAVGGPAIRMMRTWHAKRNPSPSDPVFRGRGNQPRTGNAVRCLMRRARARAGIAEDVNGERVVVYTWRHTGATTAIRNGVQQIILSRMMGHTKLETTARYVHPAESDMTEGIEIATRRKKPKSSGPESPPGKGLPAVTPPPE